MFDSLSILIHIINSIFSGLFTGQFLKSKENRKITIILWAAIYFISQIVIFDIIHSQYSFGNVAGVIINILLLIGMQLVFFHMELSRQIFVSFSFVAGKEIVKYVVSVFNYALGVSIGNWINSLVMQAKIVTTNQVEAAICISITLRMMIITVENGMIGFIFDTVPATLFWVPIICILLLGTVIANVTLFQSVVHYHEENRIRTLLENQVSQMQKEVQEIQEIYTDIRGLRHDLRGHISNITQYVKKYSNEEVDELNCYIRNMEETVDRMEFSCQTGNAITDIIIHQKKQETDRAGVKFIVDFNYPKDLQIDVYDIGVILNNALENAIEAVTLIESDKYISLHSYKKGSLFFIEVKNNFYGELTADKESGLPQSNKEDKKYHGMGLVNIQRCARKYKGDIDIVVESSKEGQQIFNLIVMLNGKPAGC